MTTRAQCHRTPLAARAAVLGCVLALTTPVSSPPVGAAEILNICGAKGADWAGAFSGEVRREDSDTAKRLTFKAASGTSTAVVVEIEDDAGAGSRIISNYVLTVREDGRGRLTFTTPWGTAHSTGTECDNEADGDSRVTRFFGEIPGESATFDITRP
ncbi:hypothetical protein [Streptomyces tsukubensis]|uniref:hypothetical protein n=1 Tax=Streptomyces tsukubensis TaxID=83656 RepID=UPI00344F6949